MLVPRSFRYTAQPNTDVCIKKRTSGRQSHERAVTLPFASPPRTSVMDPRPNMDMSTFVSKPVSIPSRSSTPTSKPVTPARSPVHHPSRRSSAFGSGHQPDALPASVAALLAVTAIPPPRRNQFRRKKSDPRRISIDELVQEWRSDVSLTSTFGSHASMDILLESREQVDPADEQLSASEASPKFRDSLASRSTSCDSIPSLEADNQSLLSLGDVVTPKSYRKRTSTIGSLSAKKDKCRTSPTTECCAEDHPLISIPVEDDYDSLGESPLSRCPPISTRRQSSFKSNLTSSLQALKLRAISSFQTLNLNGSAFSNPSTSSFSDETLWQNPFLFPHFSSEVRPAAFSGTPSRSQRQYLNPIPLNFDDQQAHYRQALHSNPALEQDAPMIQMQTYSARGRGTSSRNSRARRASSSNGGGGTAPPSPDPRSEAGRAMSGPPLVRQREPRENSDFLRVVVLEMNMRREGKLDEGMGGRARIYLPPRKAVGGAAAGQGRRRGEKGVVPRRWVGVSV